MVVWLERGANDLHTVQLMPLPPHHLLLHQNPVVLTFLLPAYPGCPGKEAVKRVSYYYYCHHHRRHFVMHTNAVQRCIIESGIIGRLLTLCVVMLLSVCIEQSHSADVTVIVSRTINCECLRHFEIQFYESFLMHIEQPRVFGEEA